MSCCPLEVDNVVLLESRSQAQAEVLSHPLGMSQCWLQQWKSLQVASRLHNASLLFTTSFVPVPRLKGLHGKENSVLENAFTFKGLQSMHPTLEVLMIVLVLLGASYGNARHGLIVLPQFSKVWFWSVLERETFWGGSYLHGGKARCQYVATHSLLF